MSTRSPIPPPVQGQSVLSYLKKLIKYVEAMRIVPGDGLVEKQSAKGTIISLSTSQASKVSDFAFYRTAGTSEEMIAFGSAVNGYAGTGNWGIEFAVGTSQVQPIISGTSFGTNVSFGTFTDLYDGDASADPVEAQTFYALPIYIDGKLVSTGGVFREHIVSKDGGPIATFI